MLQHRAFRLSSSWKLFSDECDRLRGIFTKLQYPVSLFNSATNRFIEEQITTKSSKTSIKEPKPSIVNQQYVVYNFKCDLCDTSYVGYTCRHLYQRIEEHRSGVIGQHIVQHRGKPAENINHLFTTLRRCKDRFECLILRCFLFKNFIQILTNNQTQLERNCSVLPSDYP
ncbi:hypothetical protein QZH41_010158 [Actinostola sp. cb2023]|nr:hypothetical protein QZH41_010158 [Actinostola sp. cb2023]